MDNNMTIKVDDNNYILYCIIPEEHLSDVPSDLFESNKSRCYQYIDGKFIFDNDKYEAELEKINNQMKQLEIETQIAGLKEQLATNDYKIIKAMELSLIGELCEYDIVELHKERQELRNQINELQNSI